jgi:dTDP-4-amino-4,6-dideoxygalactose transaminase
VEELEAIARRNDIRLLFDAAHATGCTHKGRSLLSYGDVSVVSFHATKSVTTFEGGAILTRDQALAEKLRRMRNFGFAGGEEVVELGINAKMCEAAAAMGLTSLENFPAAVERNRASYLQYRRELAGIPGLQVMEYPDSERNSYQYLIVEVDASCPATRDELVRALAANRVIAKRYFYPGCHRLEPYRSRAKAPAHLPATDRLAKSLMALPTGGSIPADMVPVIGGVIRAEVQRAATMREVPRVTRVEENRAGGVSRHG